MRRNLSQISDMDEDGAFMLRMSRSDWGESFSESFSSFSFTDESSECKLCVWEIVKETWDFILSIRIFSWLIEDFRRFSWTSSYLLDTCKSFMQSSSIYN